MSARPAGAALVLAVLLGGAAQAAAQQEAPVDRIMAVVGDRLLLESEWREQTAVLASQYDLEPVDEAFERLALETFEQMLRDLVIVAAAERDSTIAVDPEVLREAVDDELAQIRSRFSSESEFVRQLEQSQWGSLAAYRVELTERKRSELLGQALLEARREEVRFPPVSDEDVRAFWEENRERFAGRPETVRFEEIPVPVTPGEPARRTAREEAERVRAEIEAGLDFATAARQYSADSLSAAQGGDLGWFPRGRMVPSFEEAAFEAPVGEIVGPIETSFGAHLLQVLDRREEEVRARHVLIPAATTAEDRRRARQEADELRDLVLAGADVDSLQAARPMGEPGQGEVVELPIDRLPGPYALALQDLEPGEAAVVSTPRGFSVVVFRGRTAGGEAPYEEVAPQLRRQLSQARAEEAFVERLRQEVYVDVRIPPERLLSG